jgi:DNA-binding transcriptional LysR family regulator
LRSGEIDVSICHPPLEDTSLSCVEIARMPFDVVMADTNPLASRENLYLRDLAGESFIVFARAVAPNMYDIVIAMCREAGFSPRVILEVAPAQSIVGMAACGVGIGLIASQMQHFPHPMAVFRRLTGTAPILTLGAAHRGGTPPIAVQRFVDVAVEVGRKLD